MVDISFSPAGVFSGANGQSVLSNPTSLQFGPDGRLYVAEQNGSINAFTLTIQNGEYVAVAHEELSLADGEEVVKSIQNHNDDGTPSSQSNRQVTGLLVAGTADNPVLYVSSSDPRIAANKDVNLDTNSGVVTRVTWNGSEWEAVDIIRGLPRSEENHSVNGLVLSPNGSKLYLAVGGNTNNGAPSKFFAYTGEYALSGTVLEIDLDDLENRPILVDENAGQGGKARNYIYDLPTLDDPSVDNGGDREDINGQDTSGPWGGNDGLNQAILPADAPLRIFADGFRNHYDLVLTQSGQLYTVDNGSNGNLGGDPVIENGQVTNKPNNGGSGDPEPLFLIEDGGYHGHPAPARSNQNVEWTAYNDDGDAIGLTVGSLADQVPNGVDIQSGFIIDPSKFTDDPSRLAESGIRIPKNDSASNTLVNIGSSSNGLVEYTNDAFGGALQGDLLVAQFNGNVTRLNLNAAGTAATAEIIEGLSGFNLPLDVTTGPNGTVFVASLGDGTIRAFAPSNEPLPDDPDFDDDGLLNAVDPFTRDPTNGRSTYVNPGNKLLYDFDANQDNNLPGPGGFGGGLTGVLIDGFTDFEDFLQGESTLQFQTVALDNVKFVTAAGGGTTVIENVWSGNPRGEDNAGAFLFHTGVTISPNVEAFTVKWTVFNPAPAANSNFDNAEQQIGGYLGTGDQSNYLKIVATPNSQGEIQVLLEDEDVVKAESFIQADDLFNVPNDSRIFFSITVDLTNETATPTVVYETATGEKTVSGSAISLSNTSVLDAILGDYSVQGVETGLAVGLFSAGQGQPGDQTFQAIFDGFEISATGDTPAILYRVNAGGGEIAAIDGGPNWSADTSANPNEFLAVAGSNHSAGFNVQPHPSVATTTNGTTPAAIFQTERWENAGGEEMQYAFDVPDGTYEVRLFVGNGYNGTSEAGKRVFDVAIEDTVLANLDDLDLSAQFGHLSGRVISNTVTVDDGQLNIEFLHEVENPLINGIEILQIGETLNSTGGQTTDDSTGGQTTDDSAGGQTTYDSTGGQTTDDSTGGQTADDSSAILYRVNAGGGEIGAIDGGPNWSADTSANPNESLTVTGSNNSAGFNVQPHPSVASITNGTTPAGIFQTERWENAGGEEMQYAFDVPDGTYEVRLFVGNGYNGTSEAGKRVFDVAIEGTVLANLDDLDLSAQFGHLSGRVISNTVTVDDGQLSIEFLHGVENPLINGIEILQISQTDSSSSEDQTNNNSSSGDNSSSGNGSTNNSPSASLTEAETILLGLSANDVDKDNNSGQGYSATTVGSATLGILVGNNNVRTSNFGNSSFKLVNTGDKQISGVVIDFQTAVFNDSVVDFDGSAGDTAARPFQADNPGDTGIVVNSNNLLPAGHLLFPGATPLANTTGTGSTTVAGGYRGLLLRFDGSNGGFETGETVGFAGDMDPNSIAGLERLGANGVDTDTLGSPPGGTFDIGGISGAELIGSSFTVLFDDGTTATGFLHSDGSQAGSIGEAVEGQQQQVAMLTVDTGDEVSGAGTFNSGENGIYGGDQPVITVHGPVGATVRVVLQKGVNPAANNSNGIAQLVADRLADAQPDFQVNNAFDVQTFDVIIGANGTATLPATAFDFVSTTSGVTFTGDDIQPLALTAAVVSQGLLADEVALGPVSQPLILTNPSALPVGATSSTGDNAPNDSSGDTTNDSSSDSSNDSPTEGTNRIRFEAEDADQVDSYRLETVSSASGGEILSFVGGDSNEMGSATFNFDGTAGSYRIVVGTFDESDGSAELKLELKDGETGAIQQLNSLLLDTNVSTAPGLNAANSQTFIEPILAENVNLTPGDSITVRGFEEGNEHARLDFIELVKQGEGELFSTPSQDSSAEEESSNDSSGSSSVTTPSQIRYEAEEADSILNYSTENLPFASGGQILSFLNGDSSNSDEVGRASFNFTGAAGSYDIIVGTFDETDGVGQISVTLDDSETDTETQLGTIVLNQSLGSNVGNAQTFITPTIASNVALTPGDRIIVQGTENSGELARFDYIDFVPVI